MARERGSAALALVNATGDQSAATQRLCVPTNGPHDIESLDAQFMPAPGTVDFGAVKVPVPADGSVVVEPSAIGRMQAVHVSVPEGRLSVSALASPRNGGLWPDLATEIDASLREGGARVRSFTGEWGRELHATTDGATSLFIGVDGSRWMLYGVATGRTRDAVALDARLRRMLRGTVVVRGKAPYPVRTVLPLTATSQLEGEAQGTPSAAPTMTLRVPASNGAVTNGAATNGASKTGGAPHVALPGAPETNGMSQAPAASSGAAPYGAVANDAVANGAVAGGPMTSGATAIGASTNAAVPPSGASYGIGPNGVGPYRTGTNGVNGHRPATNGVAPDSAVGSGQYPTGGFAGGAHPTGAPVNGWNPRDPHPSGATPYSGPPPGAGNGASAYTAPPPHFSTGGTPPQGVPAGWAHDTGAHRHGSSATAANPVPEPPQTTVIPALPGPVERPWAPPPASVLPPSVTAERMGPTAQPDIPPSSPTPGEPDLQQQPSWADSRPHAAEPAAPAFSPSHWDPLHDPLPGGLDPLPDPVTARADAVGALPDTAAPPFDASSASSSRAVEQPDVGTPLYDAASASGRWRQRSAPPDVGTPLFDAEWASEAWRRSTDPDERAMQSDMGTPLFDAASDGLRRPTQHGGVGVPAEVDGVSGSGGRRWAAEPYAAPAPGGRRRREPVGHDPQPRHGTSRLDPSARSRRHGEPDAESLRAESFRADSSFRAVTPGPFSPEVAEDRRPGRRRAPETPTTATGKHEAGATSVRHDDDANSRHAGPGNRHSAGGGSSPRVPPTQWAWPKDPPSVDGSAEAPSGRRAADPAPTSWSAAELLDARNEGGRRRRSEAARHGYPSDPDAGRHHRP